MTNQNVPLGATAVSDYRTKIIDRDNKQHSRMDSVGQDSVKAGDFNQILTKKLYKNMGTLISQFGDNDNCEEMVKKYFPLNLLGSRAEKGHYQLMVPKATFRRICIHQWKEGEMAEMSVTGADLWISTADNANNPVTSGFLLKNGQIIIINPDQFGDLNKKFMIATNISLTDSADLIFNIVQRQPK